MSRPIIRDRALDLRALRWIDGKGYGPGHGRGCESGRYPNQEHEHQQADTATSEWSEVTNTRTGPDGQKHVVYTATASGTAVDEQGNTYRFNYHNHQRYAVPADGSSFQVQMNDHFNLVGSGGANDIHARFAALLTFESEDDLAGFNVSEFEFINQRGYEGEGFPPCDPI